MTRGQSQATGLGTYFSDSARRWRSGGRDGQVIVVSVLSLASFALLALSLATYRWFPVGVFVLPLLVGMLLLRFGPLLILSGIELTLAVLALVGNDMTPVRPSTLVLLVAVAVILFQSSQFHENLPITLSGVMLTDLREKLQAQGHVGPLPDGWHAQSGLATAGGTEFAGDFVVSYVSPDQRRLEVVLVDVSGKGVTVATSALQFAGALGGLLGSMPAKNLFEAANAFMLRQRWDEGFATAVHVGIDLTTGDFTVTSAGHLPAMHWVGSRRTWELDGAHGLALGVERHVDFTESSGCLEIGDAVLLYTDGMVEAHGLELADALEWLRNEASRVVADGFAGAAPRLLESARNPKDDRAVVIIDRR